MSKTFKIIIVTISILATILVIYIAPRVIPYTPPSPNIVKTDQGSFELKIRDYNGFYSNNNNYTYESYKHYENYAKDYYSRISDSVKIPNLIVIQGVVDPGGEILSPSITFSLNNTKLFEAIYIYNHDINYSNFIFAKKFIFRTFLNYTEDGTAKPITLEDLLQTPEYQNLKLN